MQHDRVLRGRRVATEPFAPVVARGIRKDGAGFVEARACDRLPDFWISLEAVLGVFVPEMECPVGAGRGEGAVDWVKADGVD